MKFRKKPVLIDAVQLSWKTWAEVCEFLRPAGILANNPGRSVETFSDQCGELPPYIELTIPTSEGMMTARHGDWLIRGVEGELYPCKPSVFAATYEPADLTDLTRIVEAAGLTPHGG